MQLFARNLKLDLSYPKVMGILNVTPDSFFDGGRYNRLHTAIDYTAKMIAAGANIIDIGGESTRPGAQEITTEEELNRVIPIIEAISKRFTVWISLNTSKPEVMQLGARTGCHMINDIRSLSVPGALEAILSINLPICLMHMQGNPKNMQQNPQYKNICNEIVNYFSNKIKFLTNSGLNKKNILLDPGFGFGKTLAHNYELLAYLSKFNNFQLPLVIGVSRKSMISDLLGVTKSASLIGSITCAIIALLQGAHIIRVHDVPETVEAIRIIEKIRKFRRFSII